MMLGGNDVKGTKVSAEALSGTHVVLQSTLSNDGIGSASAQVAPGAQVMLQSTLATSPSSSADSFGSRNSRSQGTGVPGPLSREAILARWPGPPSIWWTFHAHEIRQMAWQITHTGFSADWWDSYWAPHLPWAADRQRRRQLLRAAFDGWKYHLHHNQWRKCQRGLWRRRRRKRSQTPANIFTDIRCT